MQKLIAIAAIVMIVPVGASAQGSDAESQVRAFLQAYERAVSARDISFLERAIADDYVLTGAGGRKTGRDQVLKYYMQERERPSYRRISLTHDNVVVRAVSNMAVVTNDYTSETAPIDAPLSDPDRTQGRHTGVFAKRNGRWMVIAEQDTEQPHDDKWIERQVTASGRDYFELVRRLSNVRRLPEPERNDALASLSRLLTDDFTCTCGEGAVSHKPEELQRYKDNATPFEAVVLLEQSVRAIDNNAAVEHGKIRYVQSDGALRREVVRRYTSTWVAWGRGWQMIAHHMSAVSE